MKAAQPAGRASEAGKRAAVLARAFEASTSRSRDGAVVTSEARSSRTAGATWSTARVNATSLALEGRVNPLSFRTNCSEDARTSSSVAGGLKLYSVLMLRHIGHPPRPGLGHSVSSLSAQSMSCTRIAGLAKEAFLPTKSSSRTPRALEHAPQQKTTS